MGALKVVREPEGAARGALCWGVMNDDVEAGCVDVPAAGVPAGRNWGVGAGTGRATGLDHQESEPAAPFVRGGAAVIAWRLNVRGMRSS